MAQSQYRLVFRGKYLPGITADEAQGNLAELFHVSPERISTLLSTLPAIIKHKLDIADGNRYLEALAEAGLITHLEPEDGWDGRERRLVQRRVAVDRRGGRRDAAILPDRRSKRRRKTDSMN